MRSLAEYIMRGRFQAFFIAFLGGLGLLLPLSQAAQGLVSLRKGWQEGLYVTLWAFLPVLTLFWLSQYGELRAYATISIFVVTYACCLVLRGTISWGITLFALLIFSGISAVLVFVSTDNLAPMLQQEWDSYMEKQPVENRVAAELTGIKISGGIAAWIGFASIIGVIVARWFQAMLYNPGGFREEFHNLRLPKQVAAVCAVGLAATYYFGTEYEFWGVLFSLPMFFAGLGLIHYTVAQFSMGALPLVVLYASFFLLVGAPTVFVAIFGLTDAWINYRKLLAKRRGQ